MAQFLENDPLVFQKHNFERISLLFWSQCPAAAPGTCGCMIRPPARCPWPGSTQKVLCCSTALATHPPLEIPSRNLYVVLNFIVEIMKDIIMQNVMQLYMLTSDIYNHDFMSLWTLFDWSYVRKMILSWCFSHRQVCLETETLSSCKTCSQTLLTTST